MGSVRLKVKDGLVTIWRTESLGKGRERIIPGTHMTVENETGIKSSLNAFHKSGVRQQGQGESNDRS